MGVVVLVTGPRTLPEGPETVIGERVVESVRVRILLPPSEAKTTGGRRSAGRGGDPRLAAARARVAAALAVTVARPDAAAILRLPAGTAAEEIAVNAAVATSPRRPALDRYAGVVYHGLDAASLDSGARARAATSLFVFSGLFGVVRADEPVPRYRVPAAASLPGLGVLATWWKPVLAEVLPPMLHGLVIDLRSTDYTAMWKAPADAVAVRVLSVRPSGPPMVVSYDSKLGKGKLARALLTAPKPARSLDDVVTAWEQAGGRDALAVGGTRLDLIL